MPRARINPLWPLSKEAHEVAETEARLARERQRDRLIANMEAHHALSDLHMPEDLRDFARRHKIEALMEQVWRAGWQSGFRLATSRADRARAEGGGDER